MFYQYFSRLQQHKPSLFCLRFVLRLQLIPRRQQLFKEHGGYGTSRMLAQQDPKFEHAKGPGTQAPRTVTTPSTQIRLNYRSRLLIC